jgi:phage tail P2-like protein
MSDIRPLIPHTSSALSHDLEAVTAERLSAIENPLRSLWDVNTCPVHLLPWLAWAFSVEVWQSHWPEGVKREVIRKAISVHRRKGTLGAVKDALAALSVGAEISEWFEHDGPAHTFRIDVLVDGVFAAGLQVSQELVREVRSLVQNTKPVHVHYALQVAERLKSPVRVALGAWDADRASECLGFTTPTYRHIARANLAVGLRDADQSREDFAFTVPVTRQRAQAGLSVGLRDAARDAMAISFEGVS